ncbi:unnamed protein product [Allacma fusca]|uniref:Uncharacterized protein n=1 Tax=Allacma fusca TaxID=39272 RepID=A0A8J2K9R3_9HEXA|nr:unnamed protein product [Allacma fusca]
MNSELMYFPEMMHIPHSICLNNTVLITIDLSSSEPPYKVITKFNGHRSCPALNVLNYHRCKMASNPSAPVSWR